MAGPGGARRAFAYPSRQGLAEYLAYGAEVEHTAQRINHALGPRRRWTPIVSRVEDDRARSLAALSISDVLLVNPVRDGLNLVAKEGPLLNRADGVLVLSREAGAWEELALAGDGALGVNPFDVSGTAETLHAALSMGTAGAPGGPPRCGRRCRAGRRPTGGPTSWGRPAPAEPSREDATPTMGLLRTIDPVEPKKGGPPDVG